MRILALLLFLTSFAAFSQKSHQHNALSRSEIGLIGGVSYYIGDLNQKHFNNSNLAGQILYRYNIHSRLAFRANFTYGAVEGYDSESKKDIYKDRNLSFQTEIYELASGLEITYFPFEIGNKRYRGTAYLMAELALAKINPKADFNGELVELQPLGTEGQGSSASDRGKYSLVQFTVPLALGFRVTLTENIGLNAEYGIRFMFSDYLDDVHSYRYADPATVLAENGPLAANLSNRSISGNRFGERGNQVSRDWYTFVGIGLTFRLGRKGNCPSAF
jgi:hypothetical protein